MVKKAREEERERERERERILFLSRLRIPVRCGICVRGPGGRRCTLLAAT